MPHNFERLNIKTIHIYVNVLLKKFQHTLSQESFKAFRPRFAGKCDLQLKDLTQLPSGYNFVVEPATNHPSS